MPLPESGKSGFSLFKRLLTPLNSTYPNTMRSAVVPDELLDALDVDDDVDVGAVGVVVVVAASSCGGSLAGSAHVSAFDDVAEALEGAVVLRSLPLLPSGGAQGKGHEDKNYLGERANSPKLTQCKLLHAQPVVAVAAWNTIA